MMEVEEVRSQREISAFVLMCSSTIMAGSFYLNLMHDIQRYMSQSFSGLRWETVCSFGSECWIGFIQTNQGFDRLFPGEHHISLYALSNYLLCDEHICLRLLLEELRNSVMKKATGLKFFSTLIRISFSEDSEIVLASCFHRIGESVLTLRTDSWGRFPVKLISFPVLAETANVVKSTDWGIHKRSARFFSSQPNQ